MSLRQDPKIRLVKRILFGKKDPPRLLKWTCVAFLVWSVIVAALMAGMGVFSLVGDPVSSAHKGVRQLMEIGPKFFFTYSALHIIIIVSIMLMWRLKSSGFGLLVFANAALVFLPFYMIEKLDFPTPSLVYSLICVGLFAIHLPRMKKEQDLKDQQEFQ